MGFTFTPNTPQPTTFPANDQPLMNQNFQYLNTFGNKDHNFSLLSSNVNDGYHKQVTFNLNQTTPGFLAPGVSVLYANAANTSSQLFFNNSGRDSQLTVFKAAAGSDVAVPTVAANGVTCLPGGLLFQWGTGVAGTPVVFPVAFSTGIFSPRVTLTPLASGVTTAPSLSGSPSGTGFNSVNTSSQAYTFHWMAIGQA